MIKTSKKDKQLVKQRIIEKLLALPNGRFPSKRINSLDDIITFHTETVQALTNESHFNCDSCG